MRTTLKEFFHFLEKIHAEVFICVFILLIILLILLNHFMFRSFYTIRKKHAGSKAEFTIQNHQAQRPLWVSAFVTGFNDGFMQRDFNLMCINDPEEMDNMVRNKGFCDVQICPRTKIKLELEYIPEPHSSGTHGNLVIRLQKRKGESFHAIHYGITGKDDGSIHILYKKKLKPDAEYYSV